MTRSPPQISPPPPTWVLGLVAALLLVLAWTCLLSPPRRKGLGHDEAISLLAITGHQRDVERMEPGVSARSSVHQRRGRLDPDRGMSDLLLGLARTDVHPPLYFVLARLWLQAGALLDPAIAQGRSLAVDRWLKRQTSLYAFAVVLALLLHGASCPEDRLQSWSAAGLFLGMPYVFFQAGNVRPYALVMLLVVLTFLACARLLRPSPRDRHALLLGLCLGAGMLSHYLFAPITLAIAATVSWKGEGRRLRHLAISASVALGMFLPWLALTGLAALRGPRHLHGSPTSWSAAATRGGRLLVQLLDLSPEGAWVQRLPLLLAVLLVVLSSLLILFSRRPTDRLLGLCGIAAFCLPLAYDVLRDGRLLSLDRSLVPLVPLLCLGGGRLLSLPGPRLGAMIAVPVLAVSLYYGDWNPERENAGTARWAGDVLHQRVERAPGLRLLAVSNVDGRGQFYRRMRYMEEDGDVVWIPPSRLAELLPPLAANYERIYFVGAKRACCGSRGGRMKGEHWKQSVRALKAEGYKIVKQWRPARGGWALLERTRGDLSMPARSRVITVGANRGAPAPKETEP